MAVASGVLVVAALSPVQAQPGPELQPQVRDASDQLLRDPDNVELTYRYAQVPIHAETFEVAAGALVAAWSPLQQVDWLKTYATPSLYDRNNLSVRLGAV